MSQTSIAFRVATEESDRRNFHQDIPTEVVEEYRRKHEARYGKLRNKFNSIFRREMKVEREKLDVSCEAHTP